MTASIDSMAYAGTVPWHGLGVALGEEGVTGAEMVRASGLDWEVRKVPVFVDRGPKGFARVPDQYAVERVDTGDVLGVVGRKYTPVQNRDAFLVPDVLQQEGAIRYETAGALGRGERIWSLAKVPGNFEVRGDEMERYLLFTNSHDGNSVVRCGLVTVRVVCQNTLTLALRGVTEEIRIPHTRSAPQAVRAAQEVLAKALLGFDAYQKVLARMADDRMDRDEMRTFAEALMNEVRGSIDAADATLAKARAKRAEEVDGLVDLYATGAGNRGASRWDALQAVTDWIDHRKRRGKDAAARVMTRFESATFGDGDRIKRTALRLLARTR